MRSVRITIGIVLWGVMLFAGLKLVDAKFEEQGHSRVDVQADVLNLATTDRRFVPIQADRDLRFVVGDPVFGFVDGQATQLGEVTGVIRAAVESGQPAKVQSATTDRAEIVLYDAENPADVVLTHYTAPNSLAATVATLLPPSKRDALAVEIRNAVLLHREEIVAELKPLLEQSIRESVGVLEDELTVALRRHREELTQLGDKYQKDLVTKEVVPLVREELLPIVRKHAEPVAEEVGKTLWDKLSLWRFGWRYIYDKSPLPERDRVRKEWQRFMEKEIVPELESRSDEIVAAIQRIFADAAKNPAVRKAVRKNLSAIIEDPEVHRIVFQILKEVMIDSPRVREVLEKTWTSPQAQKAFRLASERFEPTAVRMGELLFGTPESGITPEFAAVLRRQILHKDQRWLVLSERTDDHRVLPDPEVIPVLAGGENTAYPGRIRRVRGSE